MWIIVVLPDGPASPQVFGDRDGKPFPDQESAERASRTFPRRGASYGVYVVPIGRI